MSIEELPRHSRWMMRVMEWDDARARYPNIWRDAMPRHVLARDRTVSRLRLGDLIAIYYPTNPARPRRSERFVGLARVSGLRRADEQGFAWIDLETAHRFDPPLDAARQPRRVFLCCDTGWPETDVRLFREVFDAAVARGWVPEEDDREPVRPAAARPSAPPVGVARTTARAEPPAPYGEHAPGEDEEAEARVEAAFRPGAEAEAKPAEPAAEPGIAPESLRTSVAVPSAAAAPARSFAGVDYSGDMRDPRDGTWLAIVELRDRVLHVKRLEATGRHGLQAFLRDPDTMLMRVEAIGLDFPFGLPLDFAERLLGQPFPGEGWWALAKKMERLSRPDYLVAVQEFREEKGEPKRYTDEVAKAFSPLHRVNPDLGPMTYHGIRMIAEDRSRYVVKPFESAIGRYLLEVYPGGFVKRFLGSTGTEDDGRDRRRAILDALGRVDPLPVRMDARAAGSCLGRRDALDAVIAARLAAVAVLTGEVERRPEDLAPGEGERVRREGWIYGLQVPA
jgi:hypothetical protein